MSKTKEEILKLVEDYDKSLRTKGILKYRNTTIELNQNSLKEFIIDFLIHNYCGPAQGLKDIGETLEANGSSQCRKGAARSVGDIYRICLGHYCRPTTLLEVMEVLYEIVHEHKVVFIYPNNQGYLGICTGVCSTIHRRIFYPAGANPTGLSTQYGLRVGNQAANTTSETSWDEFKVIAEDYVILFEEEFQAKQLRITREILQEVLESKEEVTIAWK